MKRNELDAIFTAKVAEYIGKGYRIITSGVEQFDDQVCAVCLTDGSTVYRIGMDRFSGMLFGVEISVKQAQATDNDTLCYYDFEDVQQQRFYSPYSFDYGQWYIEDENQALMASKTHKKRFEQMCSYNHKSIRCKPDGAFIKKLRRKLWDSKLTSDQVSIEVSPVYDIPQRYKVTVNGKSVSF